MRLDSVTRGYTQRFLNHFHVLPPYSNIENSERWLKMLARGPRPTTNSLISPQSGPFCEPVHPTHQAACRLTGLGTGHRQIACMQGDHATLQGSLRIQKQWNPTDVCLGVGRGHLLLLLLLLAQHHVLHHARHGRVLRQWQRLTGCCTLFRCSQSAPCCHSRGIC